MEDKDDEGKGYCSIHGENVTFWVVCGHIESRTAEEAQLRPDWIAVCPFCAQEPLPSVADLWALCEGCLKDRLNNIDVVYGMGFLAKGKSKSH